MRNKRFLIFLCLTIIFSLLAAKAVMGAIRTYAPVVRYRDPVQVVVARAEILPYTDITNNRVEIREYPASVVPDDAVTDPEKIRGQVSRGLLLPGDLIREGHLVSGEATENPVVARLSTLGQVNMRAFPLPLPEGFIVKEGDRIDIVYVEGSRDYSSARLAFRNLLVLDVEEKQAFLAVDVGEVERMAEILSRGQVVYLLTPAGRGAKGCR